jgi:hypothetical protein
MVTSTIPTDRETTQVRRRKRANQHRCRALLLSLLTEPAPLVWGKLKGGPLRPHHPLVDFLKGG